MKKIIYSSRPHHQRRGPGEMNHTEARYARYLETLRLAGEILSWHFEDHALVLSHNVKGGRNGSSYTPDFRVRIADGDGVRIEFHDCKGYSAKEHGPWIEPDAREKIKVAAELYPDYLFVVVWEERGKWMRREY